MKLYTDLVAETLPQIKEVFPWDIEEIRQKNPDLIMLDTREPYEYQKARIAGTINVPRGILESACDWGYEETVPELAAARNKEILVICRSGNRSALAACTMQLMGYNKVMSLKTGIVGWNDYELPMLDTEGKAIDVDDGDAMFQPNVSQEQMGPQTT